MNRDVKRLLGLKCTDEGHCVTADLTRLVQIFIDLASCMDVELANPKLKFSWDQTTIQSTVSYIYTLSLHRRPLYHCKRDYS